MAGVEDKTQMKITVPDNWDTIEGNPPVPSPDGGKLVDPPAGSDDKSKSTDNKKTKPAPYDQDPKWIAARAAQKSLDSIMGKVGVSSADELQALIDKSASVLGRLEGVDLDKVLASAKELDRTKSFMAEEELKKLEADETFEETITRQKAEITDLKKGFSTRNEQDSDMKQAQTVLKSFTSTVEKAIAADVDLPEEFHGFTKLLMGVGNPANEIDISDKAAVKKMTGDLTKVVREFEQEVIKRYRAGKTSTPPISSSTETTSEGRKPIKSIKDGTKVIRELLSKTGLKM